MPESPLERQIRTYAFNHGCDVDEATYMVIKDVARKLSPKDVDGLYDALFGKGKETGNE